MQTFQQLAAAFLNAIVELFTAVLECCLATASSSKIVCSSFVYSQIIKNTYLIFTHIWLPVLMNIFKNETSVVH